MKPRPITALQRWMRDGRWSDPALAVAINDELKRQGSRRRVSERSVAKWRRGDALPRLETQLAIKEVTAGAITPDDLVEGASHVSDSQGSADS